MGATYRTPASTATVVDAARRGAEAGLFERVQELALVIREHADAAEQERRLPKPVHQALIAGGFQRMLTPRSLGGFELDPVSCASIVEEIAGIDSAAAWALQAPNVNAWWASRLSDDGAEEFYRSDPSRMMAAAFHPPQQATEVPGGYRVTGRAPLASGVHDSEWILFSAFIMEGDKPRMTEAGPAMIAVIMLMNNLDPDVAERPDDLVVYGGSGKAARNWEAFDAIVAELRRLEADETLLVQSGKPVGVFRTHTGAPRVIIANAMLVPAWATWETFRDLEHRGLTMYGQMTAGSWIYIGTQGILQGTYETFAAAARRHFGGSLSGRMVVSAGLGGM